MALAKEKMTKYFKSSGPSKTKFGGSLSYRGVPQHDTNGEPIPRKVRLAIAKELAKIKERDHVFDVHSVQGDSTNYVMTFDSRDKAMEWIEQNVENPADYIVVSRPKSESKVEKTPTNEIPEPSEEEGRSAVAKSFELY